MHAALSEVLAALPDSNRPLVEIAADADAAIAARAADGFDEADAEKAMARRSKHSTAVSKASNAGSSRQ
jgi:hypothetical protein